MHLIGFTLFEFQTSMASAMKKKKRWKNVCSDDSPRPACACIGNNERRPGTKTKQSTEIVAHV